jgi:hypothetical protein
LLQYTVTSVPPPELLLATAEVDADDEPPAEVDELDEPDEPELVVLLSPPVPVCALVDDAPPDDAPPDDVPPDDAPPDPTRPELAVIPDPIALDAPP